MNKKNRHLRVTKYVIYKQTYFDKVDLFWSFCGAFIGIACIAFIQSQNFENIDNIFLIGSFGASAVLVYGAINSPLAQPRNLLGGHIVSAIIGVSIYKLIPDILWINAPLSVSLSIVAMQYSKTLHPPGGATALIAVIGSEKIKSLGYYYVLSPVLSGACILLIFALIFNNISNKREYPSINSFSNRFFLKIIKRVKNATKV